MGRFIFFKVLFFVVLFFSFISEAKMISSKHKPPGTLVSRPGIPNCYNSFNPVEALELYNLPEVREVSDEAGIQIMDLKRTTSCIVSTEPPMVFVFNSQPDREVKNQFARKVVNFLKSFPKDFLRSLRGVRIVMVGFSSQPIAGVEIDSSLFILTNSGTPTIAHEFMHVFDHIKNPIVRENWFSTEDRLHCTYESESNSYVSGSIGSGIPLVSLESAHSQCHISGYARTNYLEDRAETFSGMTEDYNRMVQLAGLPTSVLSVKMAAIKADLSQYSEKMNESFWTSRSRGDFSESYGTCSSGGRESNCSNFDGPAQHADWAGSISTISRLEPNRFDVPLNLGPVEASSSNEVAGSVIPPGVITPAVPVTPPGVITPAVPDDPED